MNEVRLTARSVGGFVLWRVLVLGALAGSLDVAWHGPDLHAIERVQAVVLWTLFATALAAPLALVATGLAWSQPRPFARSSVWSTVLGVLGCLWLLVAVRSGQATVASAVLVGAAVVVWTRAGRRVGDASDTLGALAAFCAVVLVAGLGGVLGPWSATGLIWGLALWARWRPLTRPEPQLAVRWKVLLHGGLVLAVASSFAAFPVSGDPGTSRRGGAPDVVLIVLDTLRADHLGAYGSDLSTPAFDRLAREGTQYRSVFANAPWTVPSHASLFTGLYARSHGCSFDRHRWLDDDFPTLAETLQDAGYQTAGFSSNIYLRVANLDQGFEVFEEPGRRLHGLALRRLVQLVGWPARWSDHGAADAVSRVQRYLARERDRSRPQFLFVNLLEPHWRHLPALADRTAHLPDGVGLLEATRISSRFYGPLAMAGQGPDGVEPVLRGLYAAAVEYQDRQLARLRELLEAHLELDDAVVIVTSDHGENLGEAGRFDHVFAVNDHLVHVPLVVRAPGRVAAGQTSDDLFQLHDVPATLADLVPGMPALGTGRSLLDAERSPREFVVVEGDPYYGHLDRMSHAAGPQRGLRRFVGSLTGVRDGRYKLVLSTHAAPVLYDVVKDPDEAQDVAALEPAVIERLEEQLVTWTAQHAEYDGALRPGTGLSEEQLEQLQAIGY